MTPNNSRITYQAVEGIDGCYDVALDGRRIGRAWSLNKSKWLVADLSGNHPYNAFTTRAAAALWLEQNRKPAPTPSKWKQRLAARNQARRSEMIPNV